MEILQAFMIPIVVIALAVAALSGFLVFARNYKKCPPNKVLVIYGRKNKQGQGYRLIRGGAALILPMLESYAAISLETFPVEPSVTETPNIDGVPVSVEATANVKISSDPVRLALAVERVLDKQPQMIHAMLKTTLEGLLRQIIGTLTVEEIIKDREKLAQQVLQGAQTELNKLGFEIDVFVFNKVWDKEGYIEALGAKRTAEVKRDAEIAQAEAKRDALLKSSEADQLGQSARRQADEQIAKANRDLALKQAEFKQETETANATAELAKALKEAEIDRELRQRKVAAEEAETKAKIALAEQEAQRMEKELVSTKIKPAEAAARASIITAEGAATAAIKSADGAAVAAVKQAEAIKTTAEAAKVKAIAEGEGQAAADAAKVRQRGLAEGEATRAKLVADAEGRLKQAEADAAMVRQKGLAEGAAIQARLLAEAEGLLKKNEALAQMSDAARLIIVLERLPEIIDHAGEAGEKVVGAAFEHVGNGLSRIDSVHMIDLGGSNSASDPVSKFAMTVPKTVFGVLAQAKAMGMDFESVLEKLGVPKGSLDGLLSQMKSAVPKTGADEHSA